VRGRVDGAGPALVRVHSECLTGDVFGSQRCDCGAQLDDALEGYGLEIVERVPLPPRVTRHNVTYLETKRLRLGHRLELGDAQAR
jgi:GTP cyclohydrolase II